MIFLILFKTNDIFEFFICVGPLEEIIVNFFSICYVFRLIILFLLLDSFMSENQKISNFTFSVNLSNFIKSARQKIIYLKKSRPFEKLGSQSPFWRPCRTQSNQRWYFLHIFHIINNTVITYLSSGVTLKICKKIIN